MAEINASRLKEVLEQLPFDNKNILLCGGAVKYIFGIKDHYEDIDIIVNENFDINAINEKYILNVNMYGGLRIKYKEKEIDLWKLEDHIIPCKTFEEVQETWLLSNSAIYYDVANDKLYNKYYNENIQINFGREIKPIEKDYINIKLRSWNVKV